VTCSSLAGENDLPIRPRHIIINTTSASVEWSLQRRTSEHNYSYYLSSWTTANKYHTSFQGNTIDRSRNFILITLSITKTSEE